MHRILLLAIFLTAPAVTHAEDVDAGLLIRNHKFEPAELRVAPGKKIKLTITNQDTTPEEFESHALNREKVIPGSGKAVVYIGPLAPGRYPFFGEFNPKTAVGTIVAE